ncbi:MAG: ABC transporter substrate-binding protein [Candidatus Accumulibacter sp.]|jgi:peptide/nickel transport system substrate-binding protein|nr:ABC transporter substrate-binding protein [Accumulibacter sp.]
MSSFHRSFKPFWKLGLAVAAGSLLALDACAQARSGGTLNWIIANEPALFVPLTTSAGSSCDLGPKVVEGLLTYDYKLNPLPLLATAWSVSKDGLQYRFELRKGVQWHDGKDFTSADVAFSIETLKQYHPRGRSTFANVERVETPDAHTALLVLSRPVPYLLTALSGTESPIVPKHLYAGTDIQTSKYNREPVGTGPFVFREWVKGSHVVLDRNPNYWDQPKPYVDRVVARFIPDAAARALALESGAADLGTKVIPFSDVERFKVSPKFTVDIRSFPYLGNQQQLYFNFDTPQLKDVKVRRAIAQSLDMEAFNQLVWFGYGTIAAAAVGPQLSKYHDPNIKYYPFDLKQAEAALDDAGYKRGADGVRFKLRLLYNPYQDKRSADFVRQSLARVGIDAVIESYDFATYITKAYTERAFDIALEQLANMFDPTVGVQRVFWSKNFKIGLPFANPSHYVNPEVDRLLEAAAIEPDEAKRYQEFKDFQRLVYADVVSVEFGTDPQITIAAKKVKNYLPTAEGIRGSFSEVSLEK